MAERNYIVHRDLYAIAFHAKIFLEGNHRVQLITDFKLDEDPGMYYHRVLSYHLFPLDLRVHLDQPTVMMIAFVKENALKSVPEDFKVVKQFNSNNLIAVRKDLVEH